MPTYFPCPNTQCSYQFDADILPPAAMVTCPLCRTRFPYRANRPVPTTAGPDAAADVQPPGPAVIKAREAPDANVWTTVIAVGAFGLVLVAVLLGLTMRGRPRVDSNTDAIDDRLNLKVEAFPAGWEEDFDNIRTPLNANVLGRKRANPDGYVAVVAQDWVDRQPRAGELDELMQGRLRAAFPPLTVEPVEGQTWASQPTQSVRFTGTRNDEHVRGEAFVMTYKGIGYVFVAWASEANWGSLQSELAGLREKVRPAGFREKWSPKRANTQAYSPEGAAYQVEDTDGVWIRGKPADEWGPKEKKFVVDDIKELDPKAVMALRAEYEIRERGDGKRKPAEALALVVELDKGGDPLAVAQAHLIERIKRGYKMATVPDVKLEPMTRSPSGTPLPTGGPAIVRLLFKSPIDKDNKVVYVISALSVGGKTVAVETHTPEKSASYVDEWMVHLAGSLKAK